MNYAVNNSTINLLMNRNVGQAVLTSVRASPEPLTRNEAMTLRELLGHISSTAGIPTPGKKVLEASSEPIATYSSDDYHMVAFKCGFALVKFGKRWTVVRLDGCKGYDYQFDEDYPKTEDTTPHHLDEEYFLDKPWQLRVMMEAEDQLESNNNSREGSLLSKHPEIPDNKIYMNGGHYSFESQIAAQDQWKRALETLSNRQRQTILLWKEGYNQEEIGKLLGITRSAVSKHFLHAVQKLKEYYSRYPNSVKCILRNEKYVGDSLMQKYYTASHLEHDSTPNKDLVVEQYYKEDTHPAIVPRDVYEDANLVLMMRDCKRGASQYPYYGRLICPHCGKPMVKVNTKRGKYPNCWICGGDGDSGTYEERTKCPVYWVKDPYLSNAVVDAIMGLDVKDLKEGDAKNVALIQEQLQKKPTVEFSYLKRLVDHITFDGWDTLIVVWNWGEESRVPYKVDRVSDYPDQTITEVDGEQRIGPFSISGFRLDNVIKAIEPIQQIILGTQIIPDNNQRFSCPPIVVRGE